MIISLVFDGHVRNVETLGLDVFLTFTIATATEFPADTFLTLVLDVWGRRWLAAGSLVVSGIFSLLATTVPIGEYRITIRSNKLYKRQFLHTLTHEICHLFGETVPLS